MTVIGIMTLLKPLSYSEWVMCVVMNACATDISLIIVSNGIADQS